MKLVFIFITACVLCVNNLDAQILHHQMLSSQGATVHLDNGFIITQTVGQIGVLGAFSDNSFKGIQGFQQLSKVKYELVLDLKLNPNIRVYPNPFYSTFNVIVPDIKIGDSVLVNVFDLEGRILYSKEEVVLDETIRIDLGSLPVSNYLLNILYKNQKFNTKIIKL